jgi:hypothetical protein
MRNVTAALLAALITVAASPAPNHTHREANNESTISGSVIAVNGDIAQFRESNGTTVTIDQSSLQRSGMSLSVGSYYTLRGVWNDDLFVAQPGNGGSYGANTNGFPFRNNGNASATVQGVITAISGDRVTIMQGLFASITIDDQPALNNGSAQNLFVGRSITAYGYWSDGTFYATSVT